MGRLIDEETLKQELYQQWFMDILLTQNSGEDMFYALSQKIDEIPTAYDPDKVVEQLEALPQCSTWNHNSDNVSRQSAIEIVKGGGVDGN